LTSGANPLIGHLEAHLGPIKAGWSRSPDGADVPVQVALFEDAPGPGNVTFTTIGLSNFPLRMNDGRSVRQELVLATHAAFKAWNVTAAIQQLSMHLVESRHALLRGDCLGPFDPLFPGSAADGLYSAIPVYFPDSFNALSMPGADPIVMTWLVPLLPTEREFCRRRGWPALERELLRQDPDLLDLRRSPMVLPDLEGS
jgi:hypothetical protein